MSAARDSLSPGTSVGSYRTVETIGKGGFSLIYLAEDEETGDEVILKELMPKHLAPRAEDGRLLPLTAGNRERPYRSRRPFFQEAAAMAALAAGDRRLEYAVGPKASPARPRRAVAGAA